MRFLLVAFLGLAPEVVALADTCSRHPIFCAIQTLRPDIDRNFGMMVSNLIHKYSNKYQQDPFISVAIGMQESRLGAALTNDIGGFEIINGKLLEKRLITDIGFWQFHYRTIRHYNLDADRLWEDLDYATKSHFQILSIKIKRCKDYKYPWACYNSASPKANRKYAKQVLRWLWRIQHLKPKPETAIVRQTPKKIRRPRSKPESVAALFTTLELPGGQNAEAR